MHPPGLRARLTYQFFIEWVSKNHIERNKNPALLQWESFKFQSPSYILVSCKTFYLFSLFKILDSFCHELKAPYEGATIDVGTGGTGGTCPPRFFNKQRSALFIFRKCPLFLKKKVPSKFRAPPSFRCFLRPWVEISEQQFIYRNHAEKV